VSRINTVRRGFVAVLLGVLALTVSACGGGESVQTLIDKTFSAPDKEKQIRSGRVALDLSVRVQGSPQLTQPIEVKLNGPFQSQGKGKLPKFDFGVSANASGQSFQAGAVSTGAAGFLKVQGTAYELPAQLYTQLQQTYAQAQQRQQAGGQTTTQPSLASLGIDPRKWLVDAKRLDDEEVGGADTAHVSARIDVPKLIADVNTALQRARSQGISGAGQLPPAISPEQQRQVTQAIRGATFDFWTGTDDHILRKMAIRLDFTVPEAERAQAQGVSGGRIAFTFSLASLNEAQRIVAPPNPRPFNELSSALGGLGLGGLVGGAPGASGSPPAGGGSAPGSGANSQAYLDCLQRAGGDVAKAQQCAQLLGR
jgi:hypothetical protein